MSRSNSARTTAASNHVRQKAVSAFKINVDGSSILREILMKKYMHVLTIHYTKTET